MNKRVNESSHQVFLCTCPATLPYSFAVHSWFVINKQGDLNRWELLSQAKQVQSSWGHIHKDAFPPFAGISAFPVSGSPRWPSTVRDSVSGEKAKQVIEVIENTPETYPHADDYHLLGPNSNTYIQWILYKCLEFESTLPINAIGKRAV